MMVLLPTLNQRDAVGQLRPALVPAKYNSDFGTNKKQACNTTYNARSNTFRGCVLCPAFFSASQAAYPGILLHR